MRELTVPQLSLVVLIGVSGSGKSTFGRAHFRPTEVISSDFCRGLVADDENDQAATPAAFALLHHIVGVRLAAGRLTVVDATNVQPEARKQLVEVARAHDVLPVAIVLDVPEDECVRRNTERPDRTFGADVVRRQRGQLRRGLKGLQREGFRTVHTLRGADEIGDVSISRTPLFNDLRREHGPFDVVGDIHGCRAELEALLDELGYAITRDAEGRPIDAHHPERRAVFVGDLVDRGPDTPGVLRLVMGMVAAGDAFCVPGNHENKLLRAMRGRNVQITHGLAESLEQLDAEPDEFRRSVETFLDGLISHYVLDDGQLVVSHAGLVERYHGRASGRVRSFCLYGQTTGETDEYGLPVRYPWAEEYRGRAMVLYGHTPVPTPEWINNTLCLDTGCVFGGRLTALRYPERELVSVPAAEVYYAPARPFTANPDAVEAAVREPDVLDITDVTGSRIVETAYQRRIGVREENAAAALEVMSRFAVDPRWLLYLPPTMSPVATSTRPDLLEHPDQAFDAYRTDGVDRVVCEEKHMGSRAVALVCRSASVAAERFGATDGRVGEVWTRTGRAFFRPELSGRLVDRLRSAAETAGLFDELATPWLLFDAELLPWSAKAEQLLRDQYAAVGAAARSALPVAVEALTAAASTGLDVGDLLVRTRARATNADAFTAAYRRYCWPTDGLDGVRLAPFQLLASDGATHHARPHAWHLDLADRLVAADPELVAPTRRVFVDTTDAESVTAATEWWTQLTAAGGEGMVVKPADNLVRGRKGVVQPGLKVRGREYLRIIYGPDYTEPANLERLRTRGLGHKRSLAQREYALGLEALDRVARGEPLWRVHQCVFAVLALESEPVDPPAVNRDFAVIHGDPSLPPGFAHPHASEQARAIAERGTILRVQVGSGVHGTSVSGQDDRDEMGICLEPAEFVTGLARVPAGTDANTHTVAFEQYERHTVWDEPGGVANRSGAGDLDVIIYSARKWCRLALAGNPTVLLPLFVPDEEVMLRTAAGAELVANADRFVSRLAGERFLGYLQSQRAAMTGESGAHTNRPELVAVHGYDTKYAMHALRLGVQGIELLSTGRVTLPIPEPDLGYLRSVRLGEVSLPEVVAALDDATTRLTALTAAPMVPDEPDRRWVDAWLHRAHVEYWDESGR